MLNETDQTALVAEANRAPSVHNTQPARWIFEGDYIHILADLSRTLDVGDPELRDAGLSCGAAVEGTLMALADRGIGVKHVHDVWDHHSETADLKPAARIHMGGAAQPDPYSHYTAKRYTWRGAFSAVEAAQVERALKWAGNAETVTLATSKADRKWLARINDRASLKFFSHRPYRRELVSWMRLTKDHPKWAEDGLNAEAMNLSGFEAKAAGAILDGAWFNVLRGIGLGKTVVSEAAKTRSAAGIVLFHMPQEASPVATGRQFYRVWLELTRMGFVAWPMAVVADDPRSNAACCDRFGIEPERKLVNLLRFGGPPKSEPYAPARLAPEDLIIPAG